MARLNTGWDCDHIIGVDDGHPHCPKMEADMEGYKVGFIIEKDDDDCIKANPFDEIKRYVKKPVIIKLLIKKGAKVTSNNRVICDVDPFMNSAIMSGSGYSYYRTYDVHAICKKRCSVAFVEGIYRMPYTPMDLEDPPCLPKDTIVHSYFSPTFRYYEGKMVNSTKKFCDIDLPIYECGSGIHFFSTPKEAFDYYYHWSIGQLIYQEHSQKTLKQLYDKDLKLKEKINKKVINNAT